MAYGLSIRNRIEIFAESMGIGVEEFERQCGLPEGYVALVVDVSRVICETLWPFQIAVPAALKLSF